MWDDLVLLRIELDRIDFSPTQRRILGLILEEWRTGEIAREVGVTPGAVSHMKRVLRGILKELDQ